MAAERFQIREHFAGAAVASGSILGERAVNDALKLDWDFIRKLWSFIQDGKDRSRRRFAMKRISAADDLCDHNSQSPDVGSLIYWLAQRLLGRHVADGAGCAQSLRAACRSIDARQAEIDDLGDVLLSQTDIAGFDVAMNHSSGMSGNQAACSLNCNNNSVAQRNRATRDFAGQPFALIDGNHTSGPAVGGQLDRITD